MSTPTTGSVNIATLDSHIIADLCAGIFYTDLSPSVFIGTGSNNILGASLKVTNPYGVVIKNFPTSGYDIYPPLTDVIELTVPTQVNNYQYGSYVFEVQLTDADSTVYTLTKTVSICAPDAKNKTRKYGTLSATIDGNCKDGKVSISADTVPTYKGKISDSQVNDFSLEYPTGSGLAKLEDISIDSFTATLFEGVYKFEGTICADYNLGDNVYVKVNYRIKREKNIRCLLDESCIYAKLAQLNTQVQSDCTDAEKIETQSIIINTLRLVKTIEIAGNAGFDASDYIDELESLLGCVCTCNCADGTPIINNSPSGDFLIEGCNVIKTIVDLTTHYQIDNYEYIIEVTDNGGALTITAPELINNDEDLPCTKRQIITFNIAPIYSQIKNQIVNSTEYNFWSSIINNSISGLDGTCLGYTSEQWAALTFSGKMQAIINKVCNGANCEAEISDNETTSIASNVTVTWSNNTDVFEVAVYMDDILQSVVLSPTEEYIIVGAADGNAHTYKLIAKCSNGSIGNVLNGNFTYFGCPLIAVPVVSSSNVPDATCPYDLTALVETLPIGVTSEWHNLNNTLASSLTATPNSASDGVYFVFAKDSNGCYSLGTQVILVCSSATNCSAPQNLIVEAIDGGFRARFQGAQFPPPSNSYTVKRRLTSDPDISGSYTTIGTPTWNASVNRWEILDATAVDFTSYTYRAISNCASSAPYVDYIFANIDCPVVTLTPSDTVIDYEFENVGGEVDKYEVSIYNEDGITLIHTDTWLPVFSNPVGGTFFYLAAGTNYAVKLKIFIDDYSVECPLVSTTTTGNEGTTVTNSTIDGGIQQVNGISGVTIMYVGPGDTETGTQSTFTGVISVVFIAPAAAITDLKLYKNGSVLQTITIPGGNGTTRNFASQTFASSDTLLITWNES